MPHTPISRASLGNMILTKLFLCFNNADGCHTPPLWSSGQSSWLQIQRSGLDSRRYKIFRDVVSLERGPLNLVSTTEELLKEKVAAPV
jgi:hypothetical protein